MKLLNVLGESKNCKPIVKRVRFSQVLKIYLHFEVHRRGKLCSPQKQINGLEESQGQLMGFVKIYKV